MKLPVLRIASTVALAVELSACTVAQPRYNPVKIDAPAAVRYAAPVRQRSLPEPAKDATDTTNLREKLDSIQAEVRLTRSTLPVVRRR